MQHKIYEEKTPGTRLGNILDTVMEKLGDQFGNPNWKHSMVIAENWEQVAGPHASYSKPGKLDPGARCLHVIAESPAHASVIRWDSADMVDKINRILDEDGGEDEDVLTEIFVVTLAPQAGQPFGLDFELETAATK